MVEAVLGQGTRARGRALGDPRRRDARVAATRPPTGDVSADKTISKVFTFSPIAPAVGGTFMVRCEAVDPVCTGSGSYEWYPGGSVTLGG